jgi:competence ComEA-like helix-hairpin-helix protein
MRPTLFLAAALCLVLGALPALAQSVNVNTASSEQLRELPGIGPKLADAIVKDRADNGSFLSLEDLSRVPGISSGLLGKLEGKVSFSGGGGGGAASVLREDNVVSESAARDTLRRFAAEPSVRELQKAVLGYVKVHPKAVDSWRLRSRTAAIMPTLRTRGDYQRQDDLRTRTNTDATEALVLTTDDRNRYRFEAQGTWNLDRLVFNPQELAVARETVRIANLRDRVLDEATRRYFERRRLQVDLELSPPRDLADRIRKELRVQELTADLDSLTGGWFSAELEASGREPY